MTIHPNGNMNVHYKIAWSEIGGNLISSKPWTHVIVVEIFQSGPKWQTNWLSDIAINRAINAGMVKTKKQKFCSINNKWYAKTWETAFLVEISLQQFHNKGLFVMKVCFQ